MNIKGSKTEINLQTAFAGESQARNKYTFFAKQAKREGYEQIAAIFEETAENERSHAKIWYKLLDGIGNTEANLLSCIAGEHEEWTRMYVEFAKVAREEGFEDIAYLFDQVAAIEKEHEARYKVLLENLQHKTVFKKEEDVAWVCRECGYIHIGQEAPEVCPVCKHPKAHFSVVCDSYR